MVVGGLLVAQEASTPANITNIPYDLNVALMCNLIPKQTLDMVGIVRPRPFQAATFCSHGGLQLRVSPQMWTISVSGWRSAAM